MAKIFFQAPSNAIIILKSARKFPNAVDLLEVKFRDPTAAITT